MDKERGVLKGGGGGMLKGRGDVEGKGEDVEGKGEDVEGNGGVNGKGDEEEVVSLIPTCG